MPPDAPLALVTRPAARAGALVARLEARGWRTLRWPLLEIVDLAPPAIPDGAQAVLATSASALRRATGDARPMLCVGDATADAARAAGFADVRSAGGDSAALAGLARASLDPHAGPLVFLRGETVAGDLAGALRAAGFTVLERVVYAARDAGPPPAPVAAALAAGAVALAAFYSPRSAATFARHAPAFAAGLRATTAVAISDAAAAPLAGLGFGRLRVAAAPDGAAMLQAVDASHPRGGGG